MGFVFHLRRQFRRFITAIQRFEDEHGDRFAFQLSGGLCLWILFYFSLCITGSR
jgi:hypothetical protein